MASIVTHPNCKCVTMPISPTTVIAHGGEYVQGPTGILGIQGLERLETFRWTNEVGGTNPDVERFEQRLKKLAMKIIKYKHRKLQWIINH